MRPCTVLLAEFITASKFVVLVDTVTVELAAVYDRPVTPDTELVVALVILPDASTVRTGIAVVLPYVFAATPVVVSLADVTVLSLIVETVTAPVAIDCDSILLNAICYFHCYC